MVLPPVAHLTWSEFLLFTVLATLLFELITVVLRFIFELRAETSLAFLGYVTGGVRIHHLYVGVVICAVALLTTLPAYWNNALLVVGAAMIFSDVLHHFAVLWPLTGSHEFHLKYPPGS